MNETLAYLSTFARFPLALRRFLASAPLTLAEAQRIVRERMAGREENFLALVERAVYGWPRSPYLPLLRLAGCELGDVRALVAQHGLEGALRALREAGVYVTYEEFKGRKPIVRPGLHLPVKPSDFANPGVKSHFNSQSSGSTGAATSVGVNLDQIADRAPHQMIAYAAHGAADAPVVAWTGILPDFTVSNMLMLAYTGPPARRWFSHFGLRDSTHWVKFGLATYYILMWMRLQGVKVPLPEYVGLDRAQVVAQTLADLLRAHGRCLLNTQVSRALRVSDAAREAGLDLTGLVIRAGGEPLTPAKARRIQESGARLMATYAMSGAGSLGYGCARSDDAGDVHLHKDVYALIDYPFQLENFGITVPAFNVTTLLATASSIMLNLQVDDYGIVEERHCGCELDAYGYTTHLSDIHSYSKLTGEGVTLIGTEMVRILEEVLPARFGGSPLDYQLMEQEDGNGLTRLSLIVHPRVQLPDDQTVIAVVLNALRQSSGMADVARSVWQRADTLQIKRAEPIWTARGKMLPLHIQRPLDKS